MNISGKIFESLAVDYTNNSLKENQDLFKVKELEEEVQVTVDEDVVEVSTDDSEVQVIQNSIESEPEELDTVEEIPSEDAPSEEVPAEPVENIEEESDSLVEDDINKFLESAYEDDEEEECKKEDIKCSKCGVEMKEPNMHNNEYICDKCYSSSDEPEKLNDSDSIQEVEAPASQADFAHTQFENITEQIRLLSELKANDTENELYTDLLSRYDEIQKLLKDYIGDQPVSLTEPVESPVEEPIDGTDADTIQDTVDTVEEIPSEDTPVEEQ